VLVQDEVELKRDPPQLGQQVGRLLQVGLTRPATFIVQPPRQPGNDGFLS
jgi:hypothetical protein